MVRVSTILYVVSAVIFAALAGGFLDIPGLVGVVFYVAGVAVANEGR